MAFGGDMDAVQRRRTEKKGKNAATESNEKSNYYRIRIADKGRQKPISFACLRKFTLEYPFITFGDGLREPMLPQPTLLGALSTLNN